MKMKPLSAAINAAITGALLSTAALAQTQEGFRGISPEAVAQVQTSLAARGFSPGPADGRITPQTLEALAAWQRSQNLPQRGFDQRSLSLLGVGTSATAGNTTIVVPGSSTAPGATVTIAPNTAPQTAVTPGGVSGSSVVTPNVTPADGTASAVPPRDPATGGTIAGAPAASLGGTTPGAPSPSLGVTPPGAPSATTSVAPGASTAVIPGTAATTAAPGTTTATPNSATPGSSAATRSGR
jgi:hypothetical protein